MKLIESLRGIENSFTNVKKVSKKEIAKTELSESLFKAASQIDKRNYRTAFDLTNGYQKALEEAIEKINPDKRWFEVTDCDIRTTLLENHNNIEATIRKILNESEDAEEVEDEADDIEERNYDDAEELTEEAIGSDLSEYQKWVDYDMEHYGKVSGNTFRKITEAGLSLVKDQYGEYEVIADRDDFAGIPYKKESCDNESLIEKIDDELFRQDYFPRGGRIDPKFKRGAKVAQDGPIDNHYYEYDYQNSTAHKISKQQAIDNFKAGKKVYKMTRSYTGPEITEITSIETIKKQPDEVIFLDDDFKLVAKNRDKQLARWDERSRQYGFNRDQLSHSYEVKHSPYSKDYSYSDARNAENNAISQEKHLKRVNLVSLLNSRDRIQREIDKYSKVIRTGKRDAWLYGTSAYNSTSDDNSWGKKRLEELKQELDEVNKQIKELTGKKESLKENSKNTLTVKVSDIDYDVSEEDLFGDETVEEIKASIPTEFTFNIRRDDWENFDHDELLTDCIGDETGWLVNSFDYEILDESLKEDTVKQGSHWVNKGEEGTHGKFKTKKEADAQRKAMFASGYKAEALKESSHPDLSEKNHTLAHALKRTWNDWANAKTREEAINILVKAIKDEGLDTPATKKFLAHIKNQPLNAIIKTATNYTMAGMGDQYKVFNPSKKKGESLTEDDKDEEAYKKLKAGYSLADALK